MWGDRHPERGGIETRERRGQRPREKGTETQREEGQRLRAETQALTRKDPQNHKLGGRGALPSGEPEQRAQASPPPVSHNPHLGRGWPARAPPLWPSAPPLPSPPPVPWARIQLKFPVTFRRPGTGENFFQYSQIPPPRRLHVFHSFPRTPESRLPSPSSLGPWSPGRDRQRPQAEPGGAEAFRTPVGQNPSPALPHVARQRDGGAG